MLLLLPAGRFSQLHIAVFPWETEGEETKEAEEEEKEVAFSPHLELQHLNRISEESTGYQTRLVGETMHEARVLKGISAETDGWLCAAHKRPLNFKHVPLSSLRKVVEVTSNVEFLSTIERRNRSIR